MASQDKRFDSIESMNAEELLVKRKRGTKKYLLAVAFACAVFFVIGLLIGYFGTSGDGGSGGEAKPSQGDGVVKGHTRCKRRSKRRMLLTCPTPVTQMKFDYVKFIQDNIDKSKIRENLRRYSSEPRLGGTDLDVKLATMMEGEWRDSGLDEVHLATYNILLSYPNTSNPNLVQVINTTDNEVIVESEKYEVVLTPNENNSHVVPPFNGFSPAGDVIGDVVYVNYGRIEDFNFLATNLSINVTGRVVIARYGKIFRGDKVQNAERFNALAVILYSDPHDFNLNNDVNNTYPHSWWLPPSGIQRGSVLATDGDPETPLYPSTDYAHRQSLSEAAAVMPKIPCQPIGYGDAQKILSRMDGPAAPEAWKGDLNFTYRLGPGLREKDTKVRVLVNNYMDVKQVHNVIGYIKGSEEPDRYVLMGNHHDAWVFGAVDPLSGSAALTEVTRVFGLMLSKGHRPRRTVIFCSWDAEEYGLMGSVEWVEDHLKVLQQRGVAYLNMDFSAVANYTLDLGTSPLLQDAVYQAAKQAPSPDVSVGATLYDLWKARPMRNASSPSPYLTNSLGSGSDMAAFYQRAGVSSVDMRMTFDRISIPILTYPLYHSSYETFFAFETFIDPGFTATDSITKFLAILASDLANADLLPFKVERYSEAVSSFFQALMDSFQEVWEKHQVNIDAFSSAVRNFTAATKAFQENLDAKKGDIIKSPLKLRMVNDRLIQLERAFLDPEGLPDRRNQKHVMFAPSQFDAYTDNSFPGIMDTMYEINHDGQQDHWQQLKQQVYIATYIIQSAAATLEDIGL
ncbi:glutamate carboxypeptidase 2-like isoform X2 [Babylonia areolata]|uniref:glutamate carboxypeptidase 2-like isoform X2 n=1 Tax=Babylonia areolata TaxID=304850 RepID=UPI003FD13E27